MREEPHPPKVSRFRPNPPPDDPVYSSVPDDGLCLNAFVLIRPESGSDRVLLGRIDPDAPWETIGGMSQRRIATMGDRWMLPSRQLRLFEAPEEAARAILKDQLGIDRLALEGPKVTSEAWQRPEPAGKGLHWDLSFLFEGTWPEGRPLSSPPWRELKFHRPSELEPRDVGRSQFDVLTLAGFLA